MRPADGKILFKEWLPDLPALDNPGLVEAKNVIPTDMTYKGFRPLDESANTAPSIPIGAYNSGNYIGTLSDLYYQAFGVGYTVRSASTYNASNYWQFAQYENMVIAVSPGVLPQAHTYGSSSNFVPISSAQTATSVGIVGQFVVLGTASTTPAVRWSAIDNPTNFPTPSSATAIATQAGSQTFDDRSGTVTAIAGGDQFGIVFQKKAIHRMTYVGGSTVFQFDQITDGIGTSLSNSVVQVDNRFFFAALDGVYVTDGVSVKNISYNKCSNVVEGWVAVANPHDVRAAVDIPNKLVMWGFGEGAGQTLNNILMYNYAEDRFSWAQNKHYVLCDGPVAFSPTSLRGGQFVATAGTATLETGEIEPNPGGYARVQGIKPLVAATLNAVTVALGTRTDQETAPSYTSETTANSRTGFADFRTEARYVRARVTVTGTFNSAQGVEFQVVPSGAV